MYLTSLLFAAGLLAAGAPDGHQQMDSLSDTLRAVTIVADKGMVVSRTDTVEIRPAVAVTDVLQRLPGLGISDYGGAAGLKSVNLRGLGSAHTTLYVDGVRVGNVQSGQADLGSLGIEEFGSAVVDYAQNSVSFNTRRPVFAPGRNVAGRASLLGGSFGTWQPSARLDFKLSERLALSAHGSGYVTDGDFHYGEGLVRSNNDLKQWRAGLDAFGSVERGGYHAKAYFNSADRGTPGSLSWPSTDRQTDRNGFVQGSFHKQLSDLYGINLSAKASTDDLLYKSEWGDTDYHQKEVQLNSAHHFRISDWWELSLAADMAWDGLKSSLYNEERTGVTGAAASAFRLGILRADVALEYDTYFDKAEGSSDRITHSALSPSASLRFALSPALDLVAFARRAYRVPTFNELYYPGYGNTELKPEDAWLTDIGFDWHSAFDGGWKAGVKLDGFYNILKDKIISAPSADNPYIWLPYNVGRVEAKGVDLSASLRHSGDWDYGCVAHYSYQSALDKTPDSYTFDQQIPFIARHTASLAADASRCGWRLDAVWNVRSGRYDSSGELPSWNTLDASLSKAFSLGGCTLTAMVSGRNLLDCRYDMVRDYPMPGRSILGGIQIAF